MLVSVRRGHQVLNSRSLADGLTRIDGEGLPGREGRERRAEEEDHSRHPPARP